MDKPDKKIGNKYASQLGYRCSIAVPEVPQGIRTLPVFYSSVITSHVASRSDVVISCANVRLPRRSIVFRCW